MQLIYLSRDDIDWFSLSRYLQILILIRRQEARGHNDPTVIAEDFQGCPVNKNLQFDSIVLGAKQG